jgi:1,4-dihydroxy-2-naphthoate octaprenyltransferase
MGTSGVRPLRYPRALRAFSLPLSVLPVVAATAAARPPGKWNVPVLAASVAAVALLHLAGNLLNDYFDFRSGVDRRLAGDSGRPGRLLVRGELPPRHVLTAAAVCLVLAAPPAGWLVWRRGPALAWFGAAAVVGLYAYTGPPLKLKYRALGEPVVFLLFGPLLMTAAAMAQTGRLETPAMLLSVPVGLGTAAVLAGNNLRDRREDAAGSVTTLAGLLGEAGGRWLYVALVASAAGGLAGLAAAGLAPRPLLGAPVAMLLLLGTFRRLRRGRVPDIDVRTAGYQTVLLAGVIASLVVESVR